MSGDIEQNPGPEGPEGEGENVVVMWLVITVRYKQCRLARVKSHTSKEQNK